MKQFLSSLLSRKFLLAVAAALVVVANKDYTALAYIVLGYFGVNIADTKLVTK